MKKIPQKNGKKFPEKFWTHFQILSSDAGSNLPPEPTATRSSCSWSSIFERFKSARKRPNLPRNAGETRTFSQTRQQEWTPYTSQKVD